VEDPHVDRRPHFLQVGCYCIGIGFVTRCICAFTLFVVLLFSCLLLLSGCPTGEHPTRVRRRRGVLAVLQTWPAWASMSSGAVVGSILTVAIAASMAGTRCSNGSLTRRELAAHWSWSLRHPDSEPFTPVEGIYKLRVEATVGSCIAQ
jgi:hypothetical protein